ncbi:MAG: DMT family transporter [Ignavibacteria bacterium]|nr:DMT family transporter [Ignavibacteria bacterium]
MKKLPASGFRSNRAEPWILLIILTLIWGSSFILIKNGLRAFSAGEAAALRIVFAALVLMPAIFISRRRISRGDLKYVLLSGIIGNLVTAFLFSLAQTKIDSAVSGILNSLTPAFTVIVASVVFGYKVRTYQIAGVLIGLAGAVALSFISSNGKVEEMNSFAWLIVAATICYALSLNIIKWKLAHVNSITIASYAFMSIAPVTLIYLLAFSDFLSDIRNHADAAASVASLALLGTFSSAVGLILYARLIKLSSPVFASSVAYLMPLVALMWGIADGEKIHALQLAAMLVIISGVLLANKNS